MKTIRHVLGEIAGGQDFDLDVTEVLREAGRQEFYFMLQSRPRLVRVSLDEQALLLATSGSIADVVRDKLASGAATLRGRIFRDLVLNDHLRPVDYLGNEQDGDTSISERAEQLALRLMAHVERIGS